MTRGRSQGSIRIIGGRWRGRRLVVPDVPGLRPTPDRVRETLFNWLAPAVHDARCLDICAGSGALGFEAASRGASSVTLVEHLPLVVSALREQAIRLDANMLEIVAADAITWLQGPPRTFDIVFLDPPFGQGLLPRYLELLSQRKWLAPRAHVYLETELDQPLLPEGWQLTRSRRAGQVRYHLALTTG
ncbi:MAG: 16S rRNA (guanine(966)-N(2))-methyltransferase RsmD [Gammaproteobacteria bacterium]|nr:16S rRNA (guanine(966)-N(2))-methyltransferase RsmD [Gammaproteobacteria bacterium]